MPKSDVLSAGTSTKEKKSEVPPDNISAKQMKGIIMILPGGGTEWAYKPFYRLTVQRVLRGDLNLVCLLGFIPPHLSTDKFELWR